MKTKWIVIALAVSTALEMRAQFAPPNSSDAVHRVKENGPHHRIWERVEAEDSHPGRSVVRTRSYVELATGLNFFDETTQQWQPSREEWHVYPDAIVAQAGPHKVVLAHDLNQGGSVDVLTPDGVRLVSSPVGLGFYDPVDGKHVMIALLKDCAAQRGATANEILFRDCFDSVRGSIRFRFTRAGLHQDVVLEQRLGLPEGFSDRSRLECYTEFAPDTSMPRVTNRVLRRELDPVLRAQMIEPDMTDARLDFGKMQMVAGIAFSVGQSGGLRPIHVAKQYQVMDGRPVLTESVEFKQLEPLLARLAAMERPSTGKLAINTKRKVMRVREQARLPRKQFRSSPKDKEIQLASSSLGDSSVVIDYELVSGATNFTFKGDTTYLISGGVNLYGTTIIEGGAVIKHFNTTNASALLTLYGPLVCQTASYRPAIFTSSDDDSVGEQIAGSSGAPTNSPSFYIDAQGPATGTAWDFKYVRMSYGLAGFFAYDDRDVLVRHCQFFHNSYGVGNWAADLAVENVLFSGCNIPLYVNANVRAENVTVDGYSTICMSSDGFSGLALTNCIITGTGEWADSESGTGTLPDPVLDHTTQLPSASGLYQTAGGGAYYLVANSTNRNAGTTNINADLLAALKTKTTYPPTLLSNITISASTNLAPQAPRDTNSLPDLGFHYDPIDFLTYWFAITNATLTVTNGAVIACYNDIGIWLQDNSAIVSVGTALSPNRFVRYSSAQEQPISLGAYGPASAIGVDAAAYGSTGPHGEFRFTEFACPAGGGHHIYHADDLSYSNLVVRDCRFWSGENLLSGPNGSASAVVWNNLFFRSAVSAIAGSSSQATLSFSNNLVYGTSASIRSPSSGTWKAYDNAFDQCAISALSLVTNGYNAYINCTNRLNPTNANDLVLGNFTYASGPLGDYYQSSTNLLNAGSVSDASLVGLYHYTTTTNQVKETNSIVDIGLHYVAVNGNGQPIDTDGDGFADYLEDRNGDGAYQNGDLTNWQSTDSDGDGVSDANEIAQGRNPNGASTASDTQNLINRRLFKPIY